MSRNRKREELLNRARSILAERVAARTALLSFIKCCWWMPHPLVVGRHTRAICDRLTKAVNDLEEGKSTFLMIAVPFRHGKTDMVSRALPAWFLGRMRALQPDVIMSGYGSSLVEGFSKMVKKVICSPSYQALVPGIQPAHGSNSASEWSVEGSAGVITAVGLGGSITGKGGSLIILDDYCKSREEARSELYRRKTWDSFTNDLLTRRAPASIVIVCATPWHIDDVRGRIAQHMAEDPVFPVFDELTFPATDAKGVRLFPERFDEDWYRSQYATLGKLACGLLDCEPTAEGGNRFAVDNIKYHDSLGEFPDLKYTRGWDLASSAKQRDKDDPDWTVGAKITVDVEHVQMGAYEALKHHLWVADVEFCRSEAPARDELIKRTAVADGAAVKQVVEAFGGYKDAFTNIEAALRGIAWVEKSQLPGDKSAKAAPLEPIFEFGNVHILRASWNPFLVQHFSQFPDGTHDDCVDAVAVAFHEYIDNMPSIA